MGITTYSNPVVPFAVQSVNTTAVPSSFQFTVTGFSYTNPNITVTTSTAHNFLVGHTVYVWGVTASGTNPFPTSLTVTAVTSTTFTFNYGATTPGTYTSGGTAQLYFSPSTSWAYMSKYVNGTYFFGGAQGQLIYSIDGKNWNFTQVPNSGTITCIDYDGTTYAVGNQNGMIYTSSTLTPTSWTQRTTSGVQIYDIKWCGGSINRWVTCGGDPATSASVVGYASSGAVTWTFPTVTGANTSAVNSIAFDGGSSIVLCAGLHATAANRTLIYSTNGTTFTGVAQDSTVYLSTSNGTANSRYGISIWWNPTESRFVAFSNGLHAASSATAATATSGAAWHTTGFRTGQFDSTQILNTNVASSSGGSPSRSIINFEPLSNKIYTWSMMSDSLRIDTHDANPTSIPYGTSTLSHYPKLSSIIIPIPGIASNYNTTFVSRQNRSSTNVCYGNNTFVVLMTDTANQYETVIRTALIS